MTKRHYLPTRVLGWASCILVWGPSCGEYTPTASRGNDSSTATAGNSSIRQTAGGASSGSSNQATAGDAAAGQAGYPLGIGGNAATEGSGGSSTEPSNGGAPTDGGSGASAGAPTTLAEGGVAGSSSSAPIVTPTATVSLDSGTTHQTLVGFGAAVAWYLTTLADHAQKAELHPILFGELGLDILRFRNAYGRSEFGDATREKIILEAATTSLGRRPIVFLASWSPPAALKANEAELCSGESTCTLKKTSEGYMYGEFAEYWLNSVTAYTNVGFAPDWVSIQNEPDYIPGSYEGCKFTAAETAEFPSYAKALDAVNTRFGSLANRPKLIGPEVLGIHWNKLQTYLPTLDMSQLWAVAHHLYERGSDGIWDWRDPGPDSFLSPMQAASSVTGALPILQTEFQTDEDQGTEGGFETAWLIHNSLVAEGVSGWLYWDLVWGAGRGLVSVPDRNSYVIRDQYYSLRHFARYTDPGDVRIGATASNPSIRASAFRSPDQRRITVIVLNTGDSQEAVGLDWGSLVPATTEVYRTTYIPGQSERWMAQPALLAGSAVVMPSRSVSTIVLSY